MSNYISATLTKQQVDEIMSLLTELDAKVSFNINLSKEQLEDIPKLSDGRLPFTQKCLNFGKQDATIVPPFTKLDDYDGDLNLYAELEPVENFVLRIAEKITAARAAAGSDAFTAALSIYNSAQRAAKQGHPGANTIVGELKPLFEKKGKTRA